MHIRYFIGYVYQMCLQDTIQSTLSVCLLCQAMLLPMRLRPLLLTTRSGFSRYAFTAFPVRIYDNTSSFQSANHYIGTYVVTKGSLFRRLSQSTCLDVEFRGWS